MRRQLCVALLVRIASAAWGVREALDRHRDRPWMEMIQDELRSHRVVVYSKTFCPHSRAVKEILRSLSQGYVAVELDHVAHGRDLQRALARMTGVSTVPQVFIDGQFVGTADGTREALASARRSARRSPAAAALRSSFCGSAWFKRAFPPLGIPAEGGLPIPRGRLRRPVCLSGSPC